MTQFNAFTRAQAVVARDIACAEMESARRVVAAIDGDDHRTLATEIEQLRRDLSRSQERVASLTEGNQALVARAREAEEGRAIVIEHTGTTEKHLRERMAELVEQRAVSGAALDEARCAQIRTSKRLVRSRAEVARLKAELDVAQGAPVAQLKSGRNGGERGEQTLGQPIKLTGDVAAVWEAVREMRPGGDHRSFRASDVQNQLIRTHANRLSLPEIRSALQQLQGRGVKPSPSLGRGSALRWQRTPIIRAAKRKARA